jgi:hypothetical protein
MSITNKHLSLGLLNCLTYKRIIKQNVQNINLNYKYEALILDQSYFS